MSITEELQQIQEKLYTLNQRKRELERWQDEERKWDAFQNIMMKHRFAVLPLDSLYQLESQDGSEKWEYAHVTLLLYEEGLCTRSGRDSGEPDWDSRTKEYAVNRYCHINGVWVQELLCMDVESCCDTEGCSDELGSYRCWHTQYNEECLLVRYKDAALQSTDSTDIFDHDVPKNLDMVPMHKLLWHALEEESPAKKPRK